jgi:C_GCAxxG_C_C family probable redox protein
MASSFGGGMGRMREVCGAVSGMLLVAGILYGYDTPGDDQAKATHYRRVQDMAAQFRQETGSIICRDILKNPPSDPSPTPRSPEFYQMRPCSRMVYLAADILSNYLSAETPSA